MRARDIGRLSADPDDDAHRYRVHAEDAYDFAKDVLPEIEYRYTVAPDEVLKSLRSARRRRAGHACDRRPRRWFDFSIAWHAEQADVKTDALIEAVQSGKPFVKTEDGNSWNLRTRTSAWWIFASPA